MSTDTRLVLPAERLRVGDVIHWTPDCEPGYDEIVTILAIEDVHEVRFIDVEFDDGDRLCLCWLAYSPVHVEQAAKATTSDFEGL